MESFRDLVASSTAARKCRDTLAQKVLDDPSLFPELLALAAAVKHRDHVKACWALERVLEQDFDLIVPHFAVFVPHLPNWTREGAVRSIAKIVWWSFLKHAKAPCFLSDETIDARVESAFTWLTSGHKVAAKVHAMRALYEAGKCRPWIYPQLVALIRKDFATQSPAYGAAAREVLAKLRRAGFDLP